MRIQPLLLFTIRFAVLTCLLAPRTWATIIDGKVTGGDALASGGKWVKLGVPLANPFPPTNSVGNDNFQSPNLYGFDENQNFIGGNALNVDIMRDGKPGNIPARTEIASHYIFFDPPNGVPHMVGYVDFDEEIIAIIRSREYLNASDFVATNNTSVTYLKPQLRGLEPEDSAVIDARNPKRLLVDLHAGTPGDYLRVLTKASGHHRLLWAGNGHYYEGVLAQGGISWNDAKLIAESRGGYLATISSVEENQFAFDLVKSPAFWVQSGRSWFGPWLGGEQAPNSPEPSGGWGWVTSESFDYSNWSSTPQQQPNNSNGLEDGIQFGGFTSISDFWNDLSKADVLHAQGFVIEYDSNPEDNLSIGRAPNGHIELSWLTHSSVIYSVLSTTDIDSGDWTVLGHVFGTGSQVTLTDSQHEAATFYRLAY